MRSISAMITSCVMLTLSMAASGATNGEQTFRLLFKAGDAVWIAEDIGGEYEQSVLHQVVTSGEAVADGQTTLKTYGDWAAIESLQAHFRTETGVALQPRPDGGLARPGLTWTLRPPAEDAALTDAFHKHVAAGGSDARSFYGADAPPARHPPVIEGAKAEPLWFSGRGLFCNYTISAAYYFPRSGLLLVFTRQAEHAVGLDTMHGFVLLKIQSK